MSDLSAFEIVAGSASVIASLIVLTGLVRKTIRTYRENREAAEEELKQELSRLRAAGGTVPARTDLGFFVVLKIGSLRDTINYFSHMKTAWLVVCSIALFLFLIYSEIDTSYSRLVQFTALVTSLVALVMVFVSFRTEKQLRRYVRTFESRIKEVWSGPVGKRSRTS